MAEVSFGPIVKSKSNKSRHKNITEYEWVEYEGNTYHPFDNVLLRPASPEEKPYLSLYYSNLYKLLLVNKLINLLILF